MKKLIYILFAVLTLISCVNTNLQLTGTWIEKDNFKNPKIFKFTEDSFQVFDGKYLNTTKIYLIKKDTFITDDYDEVHKTKVRLTGNVLSFIDLKSDTVYFSLEKGDFNNSLDYFNLKKGVNICLPKQKSEEHRNTDHVNSIYCDSQANLYFNGDKVNIKNLASKYKPQETFEINYNSIYCDKSVNLSVLNEIKKELIMSGYNFVSYITLNDKNQLEEINVRLPQTIESQSILDLIPENNFETLICHITNDSIVLNELEISSEQLFSTLKNKISQKKNELNVNVYFDTTMNYESYIKEFYNIRNAYYTVRKEYSLAKFGDPNYQFMDDSISNAIKDLYPMRFIEINENDYKRLKYAP
jgi:biopolymer transport protein ExbD